MTFALSSPGPVRVDVIDVLGRQVALYDGPLGAGEQQFGLPGLLSGPYGVRVQAAPSVVATWIAVLG